MIGPPLLWWKITEPEQDVASAERRPKYVRLLATATPGNALNYRSGSKRRACSFVRLGVLPPGGITYKHTPFHVCHLSLRPRCRKLFPSSICCPHEKDRIPLLRALDALAAIADPL